MGCDCCLPSYSAVVIDLGCSEFGLWLMSGDLARLPMNSTSMRQRCLSPVVQDRPAVDSPLIRRDEERIVEVFEGIAETGRPNGVH